MHAYVCVGQNRLAVDFVVVILIGNISFYYFFFPIKEHTLAKYLH